MDIMRALGTPRRREILRLIWNREASAGEIREANAGITFGAVSQHLRVLERAGLVEQRREGVWRYYRARRERLGVLQSWLESMWDSALYRLKLQAELEEARRGPRPRKTKTRRKKS
jgi:DNA-binding transcriptional ArsR family regulator